MAAVGHSGPATSVALVLRIAPMAEFAAIISQSGIPIVRTSIPTHVYQWVRDHVAAGVRFVTQNGLYDWGWLRAEAGIKMPPTASMRSARSRR